MLAITLLIYTVALAVEDFTRRLTIIATGIIKWLTRLGRDAVEV